MKYDLINQDVEKIERYDQIQEVANKHNVSFDTIRARLKSMGKSFKSETPNKRLNESDPEFQRIISTIKLRYADEGPKLIAAELGRSETYIMSWARKLGIKSLNHRKRVAETQTRNNLNCNVNVFDDPLTPEAAYFLGLLWTDGHIQGDYFLSISLTQPEWHLLESLAKFLDWKGEFTPAHRQDSEKQWQTGFIIGNKILVGKLTSRGLVPRKSLIDPDPLKGIPDHLYHHFARGWFDGDGSSTYGGKSNYVTPRFYWYGSHKALTNLRDNIVRLADVSYKELYESHKTPTNKCWGVSWAAWEDVSRLLQWMHKDGGTYAFRKHDIPLIQLHKYYNMEEYRRNYITLE